MRKTINNLILRPLGLDLQKANDGYHRVKDIYGHQAFKMRDPRSDSLFKSLADKVISEKSTLFYYDRLYTLYQAILNIRIKNPVILEAGVYKGGSSYFMASLARKIFSDEFKLYSIDTFDGHSEKDLQKGPEGSQKPGWFNDTSYEAVRNYLQSYPTVKVIKSRVQDCEGKFGNELFSLIHLDMDISGPTKWALEYFGKRMIRGVL